MSIFEPYIPERAIQSRAQALWEKPSCPSAARETRNLWKTEGGEDVESTDCVRGGVGGAPKPSKPLKAFKTLSQTLNGVESVAD